MSDLTDTMFTLIHESGVPMSDPLLVKVRASYFTEDGEYTLFKDSKHQSVFGIPTARVHYVARDGAV